MRGSIPALLTPALLAIVLSGCASNDQALRKPADRTLAHNVCPPLGAAEQNQVALAAASRWVDMISADETFAYGPVRVIWVHPPEELRGRCQ